ncbi:Lipopolysaccharide kinase (Kdo/WaaP) family protein [Salinimicrobium catena]|uniref:Lipopolysaccharide kinase (Kdo/WaaP) family protein n=1 Tax=Salinimicrobium catena TaxID=390640 RepID=A0A1H5P8I7_9FLAO|nr:lipopolysaccharide kinase InaA family protein [Salinimicrobium catena]SDL74349.1 Lipopolysaccharide kinase (Kdo/WaaP) family protein [Salinimicrobium catena]SEF10282.1 Lipopolysaccharide kinase (Kdo/WaaP) family protein [Salinimicrobium catena]
MNFIVSNKHTSKEREILALLQNFENQGKLFGNGARNKIKIFNLDGQEVNIKSFKVPNLVNKIAYRFFRKSKAQRSFEYAHQLLDRGIGTPYPVAYAEEKDGLLFKKSFYVSEHLQSDLTYRTLVQQPDYPEKERILRAFTRFTYELHEKGIQFLDHSPGNTLIKLNGGDYQFFLVDLNRMNFKTLSFEERMKNFSRLTPEKGMVAIMASEYAELSNRPEAEVFEKMWGYTEEFQQKFLKKKRLKKKLKFWKK